jgi:hypothetical protein
MFVLEWGRILNEKLKPEKRISGGDGGLGWCAR